MRSATHAERLFASAPDASPRLARNLALLVSLALHLACFALLWPARDVASSAPAAFEVELVASDEKAPQADTPADMPEEPASAPAMQEAAAPPQLAQAAPAETATEHKTDEPDAEALAARDREKVEQATAPAPAAAAMAAATDSEDAAARRAKARAYAGLVSAELNRRRIYPAAARSRGITGAAKVGFTIDATGRVARFAILASSGHAILDAAVTKIMQAMQTSPPPDGAFDAIVTIRFGLR